MRLYMTALTVLPAKNLSRLRTLIGACFHSRFNDNISFEDLRKMAKNKGIKEKKVLKPVIDKGTNLIKKPGEIYLVVIGTGGPGSTRALLLTHNFSRYLFNCGEGTQRLGSTSKGLSAASLANYRGLKNIFFTHKSWDNFGGLMSMALTLDSHNKLKEGDKKVKEPSEDKQVALNIYGPEGIEEIVYMSRNFDEKSTTTIVKQEGDYSDGWIDISPVKFYSSLKSESVSPDAELFSEPDAKRQRLSPTSEEPSSDTAFAYICTASKMRPKINMVKVYEAGIKVGPDVGKLQNGLNVELPDGRIVTPDMVTDALPTNERPFLVVECPNKNFLPSLLADERLQSFQKPELSNSLSVIVHMTPAHIYNTEEYQTWMKRFSKNTSHLVLNKEAGESDLVRSREHQIRLNMVDNVVFPLLPEVNKPMLSGLKPDSNGKEAIEEGQTVIACTGQYYCYRGHKRGFNINEEIDSEDILKELKENPEVMSELGKLRESLPRSEPESKADDEESESESSSLNYPRVVFLGTGSAEGQKLRAQSCILVQLSKHTIILLDCGENAYGQLFRFYGQKKAIQVLRKIKGVFVSHLHADHHQGLLTLLKERKFALEGKGVPYEPALVMAPIQMRRWLKFYEDEVEPVSHLLRLCHHQQDMETLDSLPFDMITPEDVVRELQLSEYNIVKIVHTNNSYAVSLKHRNGFRLTYSGDCRPSDNLAALGKDSDLLIHEATHEDALEDMARYTKHSTFSEALSVGAKMRAKHIILTHFSQRYAYCVPTKNLDLPPNVGIAFDNMKVCPKTLSRLPKLIPALSAVFSEQLEKLSSDSFKRDMRQKLQQDDLPDKLQKKNDNKLKQERTKKYAQQERNKKIKTENSKQHQKENSKTER